MAEDKLSKILQDTLGNLAIPVMKVFENNFKDISSSVSSRDEIAEKISHITDKTEMISLMNVYATEIRNRDADVKIPDDKLHKYLQPILGNACTVSAVRFLEQLNPELKGNEELRDKLIKEIDKVPEDDRKCMVGAALKISKIKNVLAENGDNSEFSYAYKDFENITTRLLKNLYNMAKYSKSITENKTYSEEELLTSINNPISVARSIFFNDIINTDIKASKDADEEISTLIAGAGCCIKDFPILVQYIAEKSAQAAEIVFNYTEYRNFSEWNKSRVVENAKSETLNGKKDIDITYGNDKKIER